MDKTHQNALALFHGHASKQELLRICAEGQNLHIKAFVAIPKISLARFIQAVELATGYKAQALIIDEASTLYLPPKELQLLVSLLSQNALTLTIAHTGAVFLPEHLLSLSMLLEASQKAFHEERGSHIKKALKHKRALGLKLGAKSFGENSEESAIIGEILKLHNDGKSLQNICDILTFNDIKSARSKTWHPTTIKRLVERHKNHPIDPCER